ncbi:MAG: DUF3883 domain-containing protein [Deltaproteobacteria bacterium]|jgi:SNF2 family DNA or RNA helicase|nr:DUF3883 domain-containing protein [Deltaproteobacteria bacterium]
MTRLEDIQPGMAVSGLAHGETVTVVSVSWVGTDALDLTYRTDRGHSRTQILYRDDAAGLAVIREGACREFAADAKELKLAMEAFRISLAHLFDPYLAVHTADIDPLPHQITAVYRDMLPRLPLRFVLADDPGAGKTVMAGLLIKELMMRGDVERALIVAPGSLCEQWADELARKFLLDFSILGSEAAAAASQRNPFEERPLLLARLDMLSRNDDLQRRLEESEWDIIVCDEAHKMSATWFGNELHETRRFRLGKLLSGRSRHFLLLTATPHNGKQQDFCQWLSLIDPDRFGARHQESSAPVDVSDVMRRLVKEDLLKFDGTKLFPERRAYQASYDLSPEEMDLYRQVTEYVQAGFNRAERIQDKRKRTAVAFALIILQRRLASSPEAIWQSLFNRKARLTERLELEKAGKGQDWISQGAGQGTAALLGDELPDDEDFTSKELETVEEEVSRYFTASRTLEELEAEIAVLADLEAQADRLRKSGADRKWDELSRLLQDRLAMYGPDGFREKLIVFTEHKATLNYLVDRISRLLGSPDSVCFIHGGLSREDKRKAAETFREDKGTSVLVATDAAGEGINLQRAHLMVNYDLPWNPNRLEQRFGRIHRIGQTEVCHLWNLVAKGTREGYVFETLLKKLEVASQDLGGKLFDVLGSITFENAPLRDLLIEAIRYGNDPDVRRRLTMKVEGGMDTDAVKALIRDNALTRDLMDPALVSEIREEMEKVQARRLQPHFLSFFFRQAFTHFKGSLHPREAGRYEITHVPADIRNRALAPEARGPVLRAYERVCFDKESRLIPGKPAATLLSPGHPLMSALISLVLEKHGHTLKEGAILIQDCDWGENPQTLYCLESSVRDGIVNRDGSQRIVSRQVRFVTMDREGNARSAGHAPHLDMRAPTREESEVLRAYVEGRNWSGGQLDSAAVEYAVREILPEHLKEVKGIRLPYIEKSERLIRQRLSSEIYYYYSQAAKLSVEERAGKPNAKLSSRQAHRKAEEHEARLDLRKDEKKREKDIAALPPLPVGCSLVIPAGLLDTLIPERATDECRADRKIELAAMNAVMELERSWGHEPLDVSSANAGYDIESSVPLGKREDGTALRFIEVKGRKAGSTSVKLTAHEILTAMNSRDNYILAIVEIEGDYKKITYLKHFIVRPPDIAVEASDFSMKKLASQGVTVYSDTVSLR